VARSVIVFLLLILVQQALCLVVLARDLGDEKHRVLTWGRLIQKHLKTESLGSLEIDARTIKDKPARVIRVQQFHENSQEILNILKPAAVLLGEGDFEVISQHNLAKTSVSFKIELPEICSGTAGRFVFRSTGGSMFDIGCTHMNKDAVMQYEFLRIRSKKLYEALHPHFPREILE